MRTLLEKAATRSPTLRSIFGVGVSLAVSGLVTTPAHASPPPPAYHADQEIIFGGVGGWDDLSVDPASARIFLSHADRVVVFDTEKSAVIKEILDTPGVHGIALAPDLKKAWSSNGKENKVSVIDLVTLTTRSKISVGENPDAIVYEPGHHEVYAFNGRSRSASIIDARADQVAATLPLPGKPEFAVADPEAHRVFVNIEDKNSIVAIDTENHKIAATWPLRGCESPSGIALDRQNHRLFSACENEVMAVTDSVRGTIVAIITTGPGTDGAAFDPESGLAFSPNGKSGTLTVIHEDSPDHYRVVQTVSTHEGARTRVLTPRTHRVYLPTADFQAAKPGERPKPVDGSQKLLVFKP